MAEICHQNCLGKTARVAEQRQVRKYYYAAQQNILVGGLFGIVK